LRNHLPAGTDFASDRSRRTRPDAPPKRCPGITPDSRKDDIARGVEPRRTRRYQRIRRTPPCRPDHDFKCNASVPDTDTRPAAHATCGREARRVDKGAIRDACGPEGRPERSSIKADTGSIRNRAATAYNPVVAFGNPAKSRRRSGRSLTSSPDARRATQPRGLQQTRSVNAYGAQRRSASPRVPGVGSRRQTSGKCFARSIYESKQCTPSNLDTSGRAALDESQSSHQCAGNPTSPIIPFRRLAIGKPDDSGRGTRV